MLRGVAKPHMQPASPDALLSVRNRSYIAAAPNHGKCGLPQYFVGSRLKASALLKYLLDIPPTELVHV